jgi:hypothetical protein
VLERDRKVSVLGICWQLLYNKTSAAGRPIYVSKYAGSCYQIVWFEILNAETKSKAFDSANAKKKKKSTNQVLRKWLGHPFI